MGIVEGYLAALSASLLWSINPGLINRFSKKHSSILINFSRNLYGSLVMLSVIYLLEDNILVDYIGIPIVYASAVFGPLLGDVLYIHSIKRIGGGNAVTIGYTYIFYAQLFSAILYGERITPTLLLGTILALMGVYIVYRGERRGVDKRGFITAMAAAASWGMGATLSKAALYYGGPLQIGFYRCLLVALTLTPFIHREAIELKARELIILGAVTGGLGFGAGMPLFLYGIKFVGVAATSLTTALTPVLGRIFARFIAGEKPSLKAYIGTAVTITGILIGLNLLSPL